MGMGVGSNSSSSQHSIRSAVGALNGFFAATLALGESNASNASSSANANATATQATKPTPTAAPAPAPAPTPVPAAANQSAAQATAPSSQTNSKPKKKLSKSAASWTPKIAQALRPASNLQPNGSIPHHSFMQQTQAQGPLQGTMQAQMQAPMQGPAGMRGYRPPNKMQPPHPQVPRPRGLQGYQ